jgi:tight adherence protein B
VIGRVRRRLYRLGIGSVPPTRDRVNLPALLDRRRRLAAVLAAVAAATAAAAAGGVVAAVIAAAYGALGMTAWLGLRRDHRTTRDRAAVIESIAALAADLRAGLAPDSAIAEARPVLRRATGGIATLADGPVLDRSVARAAGRVAAAWQLSERLGAPLADLLDRVEADLRSAERTRTGVAGQTAGARATTWLLAALPLAGVGVGYGMGVDPAHALLHTPIGAGCALGALAFQCAGLAWSAVLQRAAIEQAAV